MRGRERNLALVDWFKTGYPLSVFTTFSEGANREFCRTQKGLEKGQDDTTGTSDIHTQRNFRYNFRIKECGHSHRNKPLSEASIVVQFYSCNPTRDLDDTDYSNILLFLDLCLSMSPLFQHTSASVSNRTTTFSSLSTPVVFGLLRSFLGWISDTSLLCRTPESEKHSLFIWKWPDSVS